MKGGMEPWERSVKYFALKTSNIFQKNKGSLFSELLFDEFSVIMRLFCNHKKTQYIYLYLVFSSYLALFTLVITVFVAKCLEINNFHVLQNNRHSFCSNIFSKVPRKLSSVARLRPREIPPWMAANQRPMLIPDILL